MSQNDFALKQPITMQIPALGQWYNDFIENNVLFKTMKLGLGPTIALHSLHGL